MQAFLVAQANIPFSIALAIVVILGMFEIIAMIAGLSVFSALDNWFSFDVDTDVDATVSVTGMTGILGWLCLNRLPLLIWFVLALSSFAIAGYVINFGYSQLFGSFLPQIITVPVALVIMFFSSHFIGNGIANILPKNETSAISIDALGGCVGKITQGRAIKGMPTEAVVRDTFGQKHYVLVEPEHDDVEFLPGVDVVLIAHQGKVWTATRFS
ncbi:YqiJ family protein [Shewanella frigidimarina]|uniref:YqiJ family protein n=1 Tax=Shewanella frigidimarina TaxID=56812 RepID=UPI003D7B6CD8